MDKLLEQFGLYVSEAIIRPSSGGRFEVSVDGKLVFSKLEVHRFPEMQELVDLVGAHIDK